MIQNAAALVTGQRTIVSDSTPVTHWQQDASAANPAVRLALVLVAPGRYTLAQGNPAGSTVATTGRRTPTPGTFTGSLYFALFASRRLVLY